MKQKMLLIAIILLFPSIAFSGGGQIYGTITAPAKSQMQIQVRCQNLVQTAYTDTNGSYRLFVPAPGECSIQVLYHNKWTIEHPIYISGNPIRYNFQIVPTGNDYVLIRR